MEMADLRLDACPEQASYTSVACTRLGPRPALVPSSGNSTGTGSTVHRSRVAVETCEHFAYPRKPRLPLPLRPRPLPSHPPDAISVFRLAGTSSWVLLARPCQLPGSGSGAPASGDTGTYTESLPLLYLAPAHCFLREKLDSF